MSIYGTLYRRLFQPSYDALRGRQTTRLLREAEQRQWLSRMAIVGFQEAELRRLLGQAGEHSPWHRQWFHRAGIRPTDIQFVNDLARLPPMSKDDVVNHRDEMLAPALRDKAFPHRTGGSTGQPLTLYMTRESYEWRNAMTLRGYGWAGALLGEKTYYLWSVPVEKQTRRQRWKERLDHGLARQRFFNNFRLSKATLPQCLDELNRYAPRVLIGYTSMLEYLARYIQKHGGLRVRLGAVITAAEGVNADQRQLLQDVFDTRVHASYGSREFKLIAMECERGGLHVSADNLVVECLRNGRPAQPGEAGQVAITDLHNYATPLIRYLIGDVASTRDGDCPCGRGLPMLEAVHGRVPDTIQTPDGKLISGIFFPHLLKEFPWIDEFQVVQRELDKVIIKLVTNDSKAADEGLAGLQRAVLGVLGDQVKLTTERVDEIERTATGKLRPVISEIPVEI